MYDRQRFLSLYVQIRDKMQANHIELSIRIYIGNKECQFYNNMIDHQFCLKTWDWPEMSNAYSIHREIDKDFQNGITSNNLFTWFADNITSEQDYLQLQKLLFDLT